MMAESRNTYSFDAIARELRRVIEEKSPLNPPAEIKAL
jgi:hypothetical protein